MSMMTRRQYLAGSAGMLATGLGPPVRRSRSSPSARAIRPTSGACRPTTCSSPASWRSAVSSSRSSRCRPATSPCSRWWRARWTWDLLPASFIIGHDKGGLVAIALIEYVGKTAQIVTRKDLNIAKVEELRGRKVANQTGSSIGNLFVDVVARNAGLGKGDFQEVRMNVNDMVAAMAAKTVDAMVNVEPYNEIAVAEGIGTSLMDFSGYDRIPVFMAATPDFVDKHADTVVAYLQAWQEVARDFKDNPGKVADVIHAFFTSKGYNMSRETFAKALARVEVDPVPATSSPACNATPSCCCARRRSPPSRTGARRCGRICGPRRRPEASGALRFHALHAQKA